MKRRRETAEVQALRLIRLLPAPIAAGILAGLRQLLRRGQVLLQRRQRLDDEGLQFGVLHVLAGLLEHLDVLLVRLDADLA